jgi:uncharacterized protein (TIGR03437 family)
MNRLAASANPPEGAAWRMSPASPDGYYEANSSVEVTVAPQPGFRFRNWMGDLSGNSPSGAVMMNAPRVVQAMLDRIPYIAPAGVSNAAGATPFAAVAPGSIVSIFGANLAAGFTVGPDSPLPQTLGGVTVRLGDRLLPIFFVSPEQVNVQMPPDAAIGAQTIVVGTADQSEVRTDFQVKRNAPGLFQQTIAGTAYGVATHEDGSAVTPDSPAQTDELITLYGTGLGPTDRPRPLGFAIPAGEVYVIADSVSVLAGDTALDAQAFAVAGRVGIDAIRFRMPAGSRTLKVSVNRTESNSVTLP